jgi:hypothetical protein
MYVEMVCGHCDSYFNCDGDEDESSALWMMMHRFANAHVPCGYMTPVNQHGEPLDATELPAVRKKVVKPRLNDDTDGLDEGG